MESRSIKLIVIGICSFVLILIGFPKTQTSDVNPAIRDLTWNDINFVHTTDTHGWYSGHLNQKQYSGNWGDFISFTTHLREIANNNNQDLLLIDTGDRHDGNGLSDITAVNGEKSLPIFIKQDYDLVTIGNHELYLWENSRQEFELVAEHFGSNYICSNVEFKLDNGSFVPFGQKYKYFETVNRKARVLAFAFLFDFTKNNDHSKVTSLKQIVDEEGWFKETIESYPEDTLDLIIIFGHMVINHEWPELFYLHTYLRKFYPKIKIQYFGGHSHIRDFRVFDENSTGLQSGRFCETVGWASMSFNNSLTNIENKFSRTYIDFNLESFLHHSKKLSLDRFDTEKGLRTTKLIRETRKQLNLEKQIAVVKNNYYVDYVPINHPRSIFRLLSERILPSLTPPNSTQNSKQRIIIINTGSIRYDLYKGPYTLDTRYIVSPFTNDWARLVIPKNVATRLATKLNENDYIMSQKIGSSFIDNRRLLPEHQFAMLSKSEELQKRQETFIHPSLQYDSNTMNPGNQRLSKGYVTVDDFGNDGDDTPHKAVVNFPVPNVVQSKELDDSLDGESLVDVVFYDFITPNILWALNELEYNITEKAEFYSSDYLNVLLDNYVRSSEI